jgi:predicted RNase H-like nuclease (RuvC/YqgF family)
LLQEIGSLLFGYTGNQFTMTAKNKRKSNDVFAEATNAGPAVVVIGNNNHPMAKVQTRLRTLRQQLEGEDSILAAILTIDQDDGDAEEALMEKSNGILSQLDQEIDQAKDACQQESGVLTHLSQTCSKLQQKHHSLNQNVQNLEQRQLQLQRKIALHQEEASQEIESIDQVEEERKRQVPRLKTQISLFASTTGIKWDFSQGDLLSGSVVRTVQTEGESNWWNIVYSMEGTILVC